MLKIFCFFFRNQAEVGHTCRGSINLQGAFIHTEDAHKFIVSNGGTQTFHLKANNEVKIPSKIPLLSKKIFCQSKKFLTFGERGEGEAELPNGPVESCP